MENNKTTPNLIAFNYLLNQAIRNKDLGSKTVKNNIEGLQAYFEKVISDLRDSNVVFTEVPLEFQQQMNMQDIMKYLNDYPNGLLNINSK